MCGILRETSGKIWEDECGKAEGIYLRTRQIAELLEKDEVGGEIPCVT